MIIILGGLYYTYYYFNPLLLNNGEVIDLNNKTRAGPKATEADIKQMTIGTTEFDSPESIRYFYDGWFRINSSEDFGKTYVLFNRGTEFIVTLTGHKLSIMYSSDNESTTSKGVHPATGVLNPASGSGKHTVIMDIATHFPFQKWVYLCINVDENTMDAYLNGKLVKSVSNVLNANSTASTPIPIRFSEFSKTSPITIGNTGVKGKIARFRREARLIDPQNVWNIYIQGPGVTDEDDNGMGDYHSKFNITRNNRVIRKFNLF
jgi:hypothetical protein